MKNVSQKFDRAFIRSHVAVVSSQEVHLKIVEKIRSVTFWAIVVNTRFIIEDQMYETLENTSRAF